MQDIKIFLKKKKLKDEKMLEKDIGILLKKKRRQKTSILSGTGKQATWIQKKLLFST